MDNNTDNNTIELTPFQERVNIHLFFSGAQRRKILDEIKKAIADGASVITIAGDEGTGKTMACRMVEKELPEEFTCVYLPSTLESFDDVVRIIALQIDTDSSDKPESTRALVSEIVATLQENDQRLVLIFDQAERMYLATIERIRKMLEQVNNDEHRLQLIFSGRPSLLENLKQLKICDFGEIKERDFLLNPLGLSETYAYLNHCAQHKLKKHAKNIFTPEVAKKIYSMAQGNLRMTNMLAAKALDTAESDSSFMAELDSVYTQEKKPAVKASTLGWLMPSSTSGRLMFGGGGLFVLILLLFLLLSDGEKPPEIQVDTIDQTEQNIAGEPVSEDIETEEKKGVEKSKIKTALQEKARYPSTTETPEIVVVQEAQIDTPKTTPQVTEAPPQVDVQQAPKIAEESKAEAETTSSAKEKQKIKNTAADVVADSQEKRGDGLAPIAAEKPSATSTPSEGLAEATTTGVVPDGPEIIEDTGQVAVSPLKVQQKKVDIKIAASEKPATATDSAAATPSQPQNEIASMEKQEALNTSPAAIADDDPQEENLSNEVVIFAEMKKRLPPYLNEVAGAKRIARIAPVKLKTSAQNRGDVTESPERNTLPSDIYQKRLAAGTSWLAQQNSDLHTVQLMVLTAEQAEDNLKKRFEDPNYRDIADRLFIIKNNDSKVFVYYGEYPDLDSARQARNTLPVFLRKHDPYAVSVKEAIAKAASLE